MLEHRVAADLDIAAERHRDARAKRHAQDLRIAADVRVVPDDEEPTQDVTRDQHARLAASKRRGREPEIRIDPHEGGLGDREVGRRRFDERLRHAALDRNSPDPILGREVHEPVVDARVRTTGMSSTRVRDAPPWRGVTMIDEVCSWTVLQMTTPSASANALGWTCETTTSGAPATGATGRAQATRSKSKARTTGARTRTSRGGR